MSQLTVNKQGSEAFVDNQRFDDLSFTSATREFKPHYSRPIEWRVIVALVASALVAFVVLWIVYGFWKLIYCWNDHYTTCETLDRIEPLVFGAVFGLTVVFVCWSIGAKLIAYIRQSQAITNRTNLVLDRFGNQFPADLFARMTTADVVGFLIRHYDAANQLEREIAPHKIYRSVNSLSLNSTNNQAAPALTTADLEPVLTPVKSDVWLDWINRQPHVILAGATGKGKTVTAKPIIAPRIAAGEQLMIIDPHSDSWFGLPVIGGGENWEEIKDVFQAIFAEYKLRHQIRDEHLKRTGQALSTTYFKRLTVVLDEAFAASMHLSSTRRGQISAWEMFTEVLSSGARKVNMSVIMLTQTANVEDLGLSGPLRQNFTRIALDQRSIKLMIAQEEKDSERRQMIYDALIGMQFPATTVIDVSVELLDRTGLDRIPDPIVRPENIWPFVRPNQNGQNRQNGHSRTDRTPNPGELHALRMSGVSREDARIVHGLEFSNDDWTAAS